MKRTTILLALVTMPLAAHADVEVGAMAGYHRFSTSNELGVADVPQAPSLNNSLLFGVRGGWFFHNMFGVEGEFGYLSTTVRNLEYDVTALTYRAHLVAQLPLGRWVPFVVAGIGAFTITSSDNAIGGNDPARRVVEDTDPMLYAGIGLKVRLGDRFGVRIDGRALSVPSSVNEVPPSDDGVKLTADFEALASFYVRFGSAHHHEPPAPPPPVNDDPDYDGVRGDADRCPADAEDKDGFEDEDGCPDLDNDRDEVPDSADKCPAQAEDKDGFEDGDGCPDLDNDRDGIADSDDKCPAEPEDTDQFEDADGCPDLDNDTDGIPDASDKCPSVAETRNGFQDEDGCADELPAQVKALVGVVQGVQFRADSAELLKTSNRALDQVAAVLKEIPDLKIEIGVHTDDVAPRPVKKGTSYADNAQLSQARAEAVQAYLVGKGIAADRLVAKGYGDSAPAVAPAGLTGAKLKAARAKNRRVEIILPHPT